MTSVDGQYSLYFVALCQYLFPFKFPLSENMVLQLRRHIVPS